MDYIKIIGLTFLVALTGCTAATSFETVQSDVSVTLNDKAPIVTGQNLRYPTTSFGQYKFKAERDGMEPMYGLVPLKFNGGYLAADILFFAPAMFFNLREVFPYYQIDMEANEIRYKKKESDEWIIYSPKPEEIQHAKTYFGE